MKPVWIINQVMDWLIIILVYKSVRSRKGMVYHEKMERKRKLHKES